MHNITYNLSQIAGMAVLQSLVQGLFIYLLLRLVLMLISGYPESVKYNVAVTALTVLTGWFLYTLFSKVCSYNWVVLNTYPSHELTQSFKFSIAAKGFKFYTEQYYYQLLGLFPYMGAVYATGLIYHLAALIYAGNRISKIKKYVSIDISLLKKVNQLSGLLLIDKKVSTGISTFINVPCIAGFFKPVILLPVSLLITLSTDEIEAILLHELAHIKRNDYLLNLIQQVMTAILFFNPFALLIGRVINSERENSCDDMVVKQTAKPLVYAHALLKLQQTSNTRMQLALAASGKKYHLLNRIERIMKTTKPAGNMRQALIILVLFIAGVSCIAWLNPGANQKPTALAVKNALLQNSFILTSDTSTAATTKRKQANTDTTKHSKTRHKTIIIDSTGNSRTYDAYQELTAEQQRQVDSAAKQGEDMARKFNSPEWKLQVDRMAKEGAAMAEKFNSPEWKAQVDRMAKEGAAMAERFNSPEWKKQMLAMSKQSEEISKKFNSPEWKAQVDKMAKQSAEMSKKFNSPEWKAQVNKMARQGAEMSKKFNSPEWKAQVERMQKQAAEMAKKFNSPEWKAKMNKWNSDKQDSTEVKERPEKPEQPEKKEQPEKPEVN